SRTLQPPATDGAVRRTRGVRFRKRLGRVGTVIGVTAQELPSPAARIEFRQVVIRGRKPRDIELPHRMTVETRRQDKFRTLKFLARFSKIKISGAVISR